MKWILLTALLAVPQTASPIPAQATVRPARQNAESNSTTYTATAPPAKSAAKTDISPQGQNRSSNVTPGTTQAPVRVSECPPGTVTKDWTDRAYWIFSLLLVVVGALQALFLYFTLRAIRRQADQMERQTERLEESIAVGRNAAAAAQSSADAANANIELIVNKERARIFVEVDPLELSNQVMLSHAVKYKVIFHGPTFAFIEDASAERVSTTDSRVPPNPPSLGGINIPKVIPPGFPAQTCNALFFRILDQFEIDQINHQRTFVHFRGFIRYKDFMERERETTFCYTWRPRAPFPAIGMERWDKSGPVEANRET